MTDCDYPKFPKIPRLHRDVVITEKIDGTNGLIHVEEWPSKPDFLPYGRTYAELDGRHFVIRAGSRNRWLTIEQDNQGFAAWVNRNAAELVRLGEGHHYGEWFGQGIQRGYGLPEKRFALFNVARWYDPNTNDSARITASLPKAVPCPHGTTVVPVLYTGGADTLNNAVKAATTVLTTVGSVAAPGFRKPEGLMVYHVAGGHYFKVLFEGDDIPKTLQKAAA